MTNERKTYVKALPEMLSFHKFQTEGTLFDLFVQQPQSCAVGYNLAQPRGGLVV